MYTLLTFTNRTVFNEHTFTVEINYIKCMPGKIHSVTAQLDRLPKQEYNPACLDDLFSLLSDPVYQDIKEYLS